MYVYKAKVWRVLRFYVLWVGKLSTKTNGSETYVGPELDTLKECYNFSLFLISIKLIMIG
jgi:hypothetical protein